MSIATLVEHLGLHHTAVRQHLAVLRDAGLILESSEHSARRDRPRFVYRASVEGTTRWSGPEPYEQLSLMLLQLLH